MNWLTDLLNFAFPRECHICGGKLADHEQFACSHCLAELPRTGYHRRQINAMEQRFAGRFPFEKATGHFFYTRDSALSQLIQDMKYRHFPGVGEMLGRLVGSELYATGFFSGVDVIVPVPMHWVKKMRRGYNQTEMIARGLGQAATLPVSTALRAVKSHRTQTAMTLEERLDNAAGLFHLDAGSGFDGKGVVLLDDVCTTGATLTSAAEAILRDAPGCRLTLLTIGVTF